MTAALPKHDDFMLPTLKVLAALGGSASNEEIETALIEQFALTPEQMELAYATTGVLIAPDRMSWARSYLKYPGFVANPKRGVWILTEEGRAAADWSDAEVRKAVAAGYAARHPRKPSKPKDAPELGQNDESDTVWADLLLAKLQSIEPAAFERLCQRLLREHGFTRVEVTGKSGDGGIDGQGVLRVNLVSFHVLFQCKRYKGSVGAPTIRDFRGAMQGRADKGLVITTGTFTPDARREATRDGAPAIDLIDGEALCDLLREVGLGVVVRPVTTYEISVDGAFFDEI
ncbi:restriction endonuclease [Sphingomonas sp. AAP5]|uniref:restriction endonuclease n=1 Tax=Sphingomonas sp. AAP5 TaxID=1523415 RepID=UPI0010570D05|nr:restriction endonuclease [Sphingomonas sp. AAP5]QBM76668.1 restriction endonuclease [Sphingomonas sp. AAP5]